MARIQLVHWNAPNARERVKSLREEGHVVVAGTPDLNKLRARPPEAMLIDLERLPMQGRDLGMWMRSAAKTRHVPLVFLGGEREKVARVKEQLPDAIYATWRGVRGAVSRALKRTPKDPVRPASVLAGYSGTPLPKKLGIKPGARVLLANAPDGFERTLGEVPDGVRLRRGTAGASDLVIWFPRSLAELERRARKMGALGDGLWVAWAKRSSGVPTDLNGNEVRRIGLANGLVDYKICAIDETWSGLKFARRKNK